MIRSLLNFIVYSNIFIGLCAFALTLETVVLLDLPPSLNWYLLLIFLCTVFVYSLHYYAKQFKGKTDNRLQWCRKNKRLLLFIIITSFIFIAGGVIFHYRAIFGNPGHFNYGNLIWFIAIPLLALGYSHPLTPWNKRALREVGWLKMASLCFIWSFTTVALPLLMLPPEVAMPVSNYGVIILFLHRFFFISALSFLFNINDYEEDKRDGIKTFVVMAGPAKSLALGSIIMPLVNLLMSLLLIRAFSLGHTVQVLAIFFPVLLLWFLFYRFSPTNDETLFAIRHDGLMIVQALLLIFAVLFHSG